MMTTTAHDELPAGTRLGPYVIESTIGFGGMATVYLARHDALGKRFALKVLSPQFVAMPNCVERFVREGRAASALHHRHVIEVFDVSVAGERPYLAMEYLRGETLADRLMRLGRLPVEAIADVLLPVVSAVVAAHAAGIIHRDLKPENVIIASEADGTERPVLLDFGISKILEGATSRALTQVGQVVGTPYYMAPEQIRAEELDGRADVYALGVMMYELSTGVRPFRAEQSVFVLMAEILLGQPVLPSTIEPRVPPAFEAVILRAMASRREDRFPAADALGRALLPFASRDVQQRWARSFGADPDAIEMPPLPPLPASRSSNPPSEPRPFDPTLATQPVGVPAQHGEPFHAVDLRALPALADFTDAELEAFCLAATARKLPPGAVLFDQGETGETCFLIVRGAIQLSKDLGAGHMVVDVLRPGTFVGQDALSDRATRSVTARATEETLLVELGRDQMQRLLGFHDRVALRLLELIAVSGIRKLRAGTRTLARLLEQRAVGRKPDGTGVTATRPLEQLRAAVREWSVRIDER
jgi:serine/threonine-protein kinase